MNVNHTSTVAERQPPSPTDLTKYRTLLTTRLNFAYFKLRHGLGDSTLLDIEQLWKRRQQKLISQIPQPRFTQQGVLDRRPAWHLTKRNKTKTTRFVHSFSPPREASNELVTVIDKDTSYPACQRKQPDIHVHPNSNKAQLSSNVHLDTCQGPSSTDSSQRIESLGVLKDCCHHRVPVKGVVPTPPSSQPLDEDCPSSQEESLARSSLDFLSYVISMQEKGVIQEDAPEFSVPGQHNAQMQSNTGAIQSNPCDCDKDSTFLDTVEHEPVSIWSGQTRHRRKTMEHATFRTPMR